MCQITQIAQFPPGNTSYCILYGSSLKYLNLQVGIDELSDVLIRLRNTGMMVQIFTRQQRRKECRGQSRSGGLPDVARSLASNV